MDRDILEVCDYYANRGVRVICAGLDTDFRGEPFGVMPELLSKAECVTKLNAICQVCGGDGKSICILPDFCLSWPIQYDRIDIIQ